MCERKQKKILLYHCAAIGDTLITIPLIRNIMRVHAGAEIDVFNFQPGPSTYHLDLLRRLGQYQSITFHVQPFELSLKTWIPRIKNMLKFRKKKYDIIYPSKSKVIRKVVSK